MSITYRKCPKWNSSNIVLIIFGEPTYETYLKSEEDKYVLGGCIIGRENI